MNDDGLLAVFRKDPYEAMRPFDLNQREIEALKKGDADALAALGVDVDALQQPPESQTWLLRTVMRVAPSAAALLLALGLWAGAPTSARAARYGRRMNARAVRRLSARYNSGVRGIRRAARVQGRMDRSSARLLPMEQVARRAVGDVGDGDGYTEDPGPILEPMDR